MDELKWLTSDQFKQVCLEATDVANDVSTPTISFSLGVGEITIAVNTQERTALEDRAVINSSTNAIPFNTKAVT
jgi:hypothetical protein